MKGKHKGVRGELWGEKFTIPTPVVVAIVQCNLKGITSKQFVRDQFKLKVKANVAVFLSAGMRAG